MYSLAFLQKILIPSALLSVLNVPSGDIMWAVTSRASNCITVWTTPSMVCVSRILSGIEELLVRWISELVDCVAERFTGFAAYDSVLRCFLATVAFITQMMTDTLIVG